MKFQDKRMKKDQQVIYKLKCISMISLLFMSVQIAGGVISHSVAILADAFHLLSDVFAYIISLQAVLLSHRKPPFFMTFGYEKVQPLGALINVSIIWFVTIELLIQATQRIAHKSVVKDPLFMLLTSFFGLGCNLYIMRVLHADVEHGGHQGCSHAHGLQHHGHKHGGKGHSHQHEHEHEHNGKKCNHDHGKKTQPKQIKGQKKMIKKNSHDNLGSHHHQHDHDHDHNHDHNHDSQCSHEDLDDRHHHHEQNKTQPNHVHSSSCSHGHDHDNDKIPVDSSRQMICDLDHDHGQDSHNCNSKGYSIVEHQAMNQQINEHISYKPYAPFINLTDEALRIAEKQQARRELFKNINIQAAHIHIISDIILSIGVIVSAIIIYWKADPEQWTYWQLADPFCTYLFSVMAIYSTVGIAKDSIIILLDGCDDREMLKDIMSELDSMEEVDSYSELRVWSMNRSKFAAAVKIALSKEKYEDLNTRDAIRDKVIALFSTREIHHYVQVEQEKEQVEELKAQ